MSDVRPFDRHELVRRANIDAVSRAIAVGAPITRDDIGLTTGLSRPTVMALVAALVAHGRVRVASAPVSAGRSAGRVATRFEIDPGAMFVVGIDVGGTSSRAAVADLSGAILATDEASTTRDGGAAVIEQMSALARSVAAQAGVDWHEIGTISIGTPGVANPDGTIRLADNVPGLDATPLAMSLGDVLGTPVVWENDVNLAAVGEYHAGIARGCRSFALLSVGTGLGMGIMLDGEVVRGSRSAAGEIAYLPIGADPTRGAGRRRGAFEVAAAGSGVVQLYRDVLGADARAGRRVTARGVYAAAGRGEPAALAAVDRHADLLARGVLAVSALLDPELIVLGGGIGTNPVLLDPLRAAVERYVSWPLRIEPSALGARAGLVGAVHRGLVVLPDIPIDIVSARLTGTDITP